jgi:hypothetical protein
MPLIRTPAPAPAAAPAPSWSRLQVGCLLGAIATFLVQKNRQLLIGRSMAPADVAAVQVRGARRGGPGRGGVRYRGMNPDTRFSLSRSRVGASV